MSCPFCDQEIPVAASACPACGRDPRSRRKPCPTCHGWTPATEASCCRCGAKFKSEMRWKIPLIILIFLLGFALAVVIEVLSQ